MEVKGNTENLFLVPPAEQLLSSVSLCHQLSQLTQSSSRMPAGGSRAGAVVPVCELSTAHSCRERGRAAAGRDSKCFGGSAC